MAKNMILTSLEGYITEQTKPERVILPDTKQFVYSTVTFETEDGQKAYFEIRQKITEQIDASSITASTKVRIGFVMLGAIKKGKSFNKLFINKLELV
jgi:hypothetical protein